MTNDNERTQPDSDPSPIGDADRTIPQNPDAAPVENPDPTLVQNAEAAEPAANPDQTLIQETPPVEDSLPAEEPTIAQNPDATIASGTSTGTGAQPAEPESDPDLPQIDSICLERRLGAGGMAKVYLGVQDTLDRRVAVKVLSDRLRDDSFQARFEREARILATIQHPSIVTCHLAGRTQCGKPFMAMEFIDGPDLRQHIEKTGPLPVLEGVRVARDLAVALQYAHGKSIIHRDVKPDNVLLQPDDSAPDDSPFPFVAKLADLGLARQNSAASDGLSMPGMMMGTMSTMAPEQFDDPDNVDFRADIYGLGCVFYAALTGHRAFVRTELTAVIDEKRVPLGPDARQKNADVPADVSKLIRKMLAGDAKDRPQSYGELVASLEELLRKLDPDAPTPSPQSKRTSILIGAAIATLLVVGAVAAGVFGEDPPPPNLPPKITVRGPTSVRPLARTTLTVEPDDPEGDALTIRWRQVGEYPTVQLDNAELATATFKVTSFVDEPTPCRFEVQVDDGINAYVADTVDVVVEAVPEKSLFGNAEDMLAGWQIRSGKWSEFEGGVNMHDNPRRKLAYATRELPAPPWRLRGSFQVRNRGNRYPQVGASLNVEPLGEIALLMRGDAERAWLEVMQIVDGEPKPFEPPKRHEWKLLDDREVAFQAIHSDGKLEVSCHVAGEDEPLRWEPLDVTPNATASMSLVVVGAGSGVFRGLQIH